MPVFMKYQGVDGSSHAPPIGDPDFLSYSYGSGSQAGADLQKGTWLTDATYDGSPAGTSMETVAKTGSSDAGADGTSSTLMLGEKYLPEDDYVLTFVEHASQPYSTDGGFIGGVFVAAGDVNLNGAEDSRGLWQINVEPDRSFGEPVTFTATIYNPEATVVTETLTIAHEGFLMF